MAMLNTLVLLAAVAGQQGQFDEQERYAREHIATARELGDRASVAYGLHLLGIVEVSHGRFAEACLLAREGLELQSDLGLPQLQARLTSSLGEYELHAGQNEAARRHLQEGLRLCKEVDWLAHVGGCLAGLGREAMARGAYEEAQRWLLEGISTFRETATFLGGIDWALALLAHVAHRLGQPLLARRHLGDALRNASRTELTISALGALATRAVILADQGKAEQAVELYALVARYPGQGNSRWFQDVYGREIAAAAAMLSPDVGAEARGRGRARDLWATVAEVLEALGDQGES